MKEIKRIYMERPASGSRTIKIRLAAKGHTVARCRVARLMRLQNLRAIYPKKRRTSSPGKGYCSTMCRRAFLAQSQDRRDVPVYIHNACGGARGIADYIRYFNEERPHQGLENMTPDDVYYRRKPLPEAA